MENRKINVLYFREDFSIHGCADLDYSVFQNRTDHPFSETQIEAIRRNSPLSLDEIRKRINEEPEAHYFRASDGIHTTSRIIRFEGKDEFVTKSNHRYQISNLLDN